MKKRLFSLLLVVMASTGMLYAEVLRDRCGSPNLWYEFDNESKEISLWIWGSGAMADRSRQSYPWSNYSLYIKDIFLGDGLTRIGRYAFYNCRYVRSVTIPNSVTTIGEGAFEDCSSLTSVNIPNNVTEIKKSTFSGCSKLTSVIIPNSVTKIDTSAFYNCFSLISLTIGNSVTKIEKEAFYNCSTLSSVDIPNSVTTIEENAFAGVRNIVYSGSASGAPWGARCLNGYVDGFVVYRDATKKELVACSVQATGKITIPNSVTTIEYDAFKNCTALTSVTIGNSVTEIGRNAFANCSSLTSLTIGNSVTTIGESAFKNCSYVTSITCEAITPPTVGDNAFYGVSRNKIVLVPFISVERYKKATGWKDFQKIIRANNGICTGKCGDNLQFSLNPEDLVLKITGSGAMYDYESGDAPWYDVNSSIKSIQLPAGLTTICKDAFEGCSKLTSIICEPTTPPTVGNNTFHNVPKDKAILYVPANSIEAYKKAEGWKEFYDIRPLANSNTDVENVLDSSADGAKKIYHNGQIYILTPDGKKYSPTGAAL